LEIFLVVKSRGERNAFVKTCLFLLLIILMYVCVGFFYGFKALHFGCFFVLVIPDLITDPSVSVKSHKE